MSLIRKSFSRLHYPVDVIAQCVRGYLAYALSLRNLEEMMAERGIAVGLPQLGWKKTNETY
jgi:putative transposase